VKNYHRDVVVVVVVVVVVRSENGCSGSGNFSVLYKYFPASSQKGSRRLKDEWESEEVGLLGVLSSLFDRPTATRGDFMKDLFFNEWRNSKRDLHSLQNNTHTYKYSTVLIWKLFLEERNGSCFHR